MTAFFCLKEGDDGNLEADDGVKEDAGVKREEVDDVSVS